MKPCIHRLVGALAVFFATMVHAVEPAVLVDQDLKDIPIRLIRLSGGTLSYFDASRRLQHTPFDNFLSLRFQRDIIVSASGIALKANGEQLAGRRVEVGDERIQWLNKWFGRVTLSMDDIAILSFQGSVAENDKPDGNEKITLKNGDAVTGFIDLWSADGITLDRDGAPLTIGWGQIAQVTFANPVERTPGYWVTLNDGTLVKLSKVGIEQERLTGTLSDGKELDVPIGEVVSIDPPGYRLIDLAKRPRKVVSGGSAFGVKIEPGVTREGYIALHAPVRVRYSIPSGVRRFAMTARLAPEAKRRGNLILRVRNEKGVLAEEHIHRDRSQVQINVVPNGTSLTIELDDHINGPVLDRLQLISPVLLVIEK